MGLYLANKDDIRTQTISKKINVKPCEDPSEHVHGVELNIFIKRNIFFCLMIFGLETQMDLRETKYLSACRHEKQADSTLHRFKRIQN